ncbi:MAG: hypothetical protein GC200_02120 [Tepidisphaera sp.]|nr:hypothetical protein [Tepidisphaera sp.]
MASSPEQNWLTQPADEPGTFTYRWKIAATSKDPYVPFSRNSGILISIASLTMLAFGFWLLLTGRYPAWPAIAIGVAVLPGSFFMALRARDTTGNRSQLPLIRVWFSRRIIEFQFCPVYTNFWRATVIDHFECPAEEIWGIELEQYRDGWHPIFARHNYAVLRIWTSHGYVRVSGIRKELQGLHAAITELTGPREASWFHSQWVRIAAIFLAAAAVAAAMWRWNLVP